METPRTNSNTNPGLSSTTDSMMNKASSGAHATVDKMAAAADEATRKAKPAIDRATEFAHQAVDRAQSAAAPAAAWLGDQTENLKATQQKLVDDTCEYVSANPLKSVAIALVAGILISRIVL